MLVAPKRDPLETLGLLAEPSYVASPVPPSPFLYRGAGPSLGGPSRMESEKGPRGRRFGRDLSRRFPVRPRSKEPSSGRAGSLCTAKDGVQNGAGATTAPTERSAKEGGRSDIRKELWSGNPCGSRVQRSLRSLPHPPRKNKGNPDSKRSRERVRALGSSHQWGDTGTGPVRGDGHSSAKIPSEPLRGFRGARNPPRAESVFPSRPSSRVLTG